MSSAELKLNWPTVGFGPKLKTESICAHSNVQATAKGKLGVFHNIPTNLRRIIKLKYSGNLYNDVFYCLRCSFFHCLLFPCYSILMFKSSQWDKLFLFHLHIIRVFRWKETILKLFYRFHSFKLASISRRIFKQLLNNC